MRILEALDKAETLNDLVSNSPAILLTLKAIETWVETTTKLVPDAKIAGHPELLPTWSIGEHYLKGDRVQLSGYAWKALASNEATEENCPIHKESETIWKQL
jgi:hypothetical protein